MFVRSSPMRSKSLSALMIVVIIRRSAGRGLVQGEQVDRALLDLDLFLVDPVVVLDHLLCELGVERDQRDSVELWVIGTPRF
jgi:hypothetical protein